MKVQTAKEEPVASAARQAAEQPGAAPNPPSLVNVSAFGIFDPKFGECLSFWGSKIPTTETFTKLGGWGGGGSPRDRLDLA